MWLSEWLNPLCRVLPLLRAGFSTVNMIVALAHLFVYTSGAAALAVPRRTLASETGFNGFVQHVADRSRIDTQNA